MTGAMLSAPALSCELAMAEHCQKVQGSGWLSSVLACGRACLKQHGDQANTNFPQGEYQSDMAAAAVLDAVPLTAAVSQGALEDRDSDDEGARRSELELSAMHGALLLFLSRAPSNLTPLQSDVQVLSISAFFISGAATTNTRAVCRHPASKLRAAGSLESVTGEDLLTSRAACSAGVHLE